MYPVSTLLKDPGCVEPLRCMAECDPSDAECSFTCGMHGMDNDHFLDFLQCSADNGCIPDYGEDGECLATYDDALQVLCSTYRVMLTWEPRF